MGIEGLNDQEYRSWLKNQAQQHQIQDTVSNYVKAYGYQPKSPSFNSINNTDQHTPAGGGGGMPWQMIATIAAQNVGSFFSNLNPGINSGDLLSDAGRSNSNIMGISFQRQNTVNKNDILDEYDKNNFSNIWKGNLGGFVGGLFGRDKLKEQMHLANMQAGRTNAIDQNTPISQMIQNKLYSNYSNTYNQIRPSLAANGIDALTQPGEIRGSMETLDNKIIRGGIPGKDSKLEQNIEPDEYIIPNKFGLSQLAKPFVQHQEYLKNLVYKNKNQKNKQIAWNTVKKSFNEDGKYVNGIAMLTRNLRKDGILAQGDNPSPNGVTHASVGWDSLAVNGLTALQGIGDYIKAKRSSVKSSNTFVQNPYAGTALNTLNSLSIPIYPVLNNMRGAEARGRYSIANSGGLGSSQKLAANVALTANTQKNIAENMFNYYKEINNLKTQSAMAALNAGQQQAQMQQSAKQFDLDYYSKAHAARQNIMNSSLSNIFGSLRQYLQDEDSRKRFESMYSLFSDDLKSRKV